MRFAPLRFAVPKNYPCAVILAGRPKIGKSWLVLLLGDRARKRCGALGLDYGTTLPLKAAFFISVLKMVGAGSNGA